ncbi:ATP-binding protein [Granulicella sp. L46]|uniref:ATP-binding protein n=1 Tax=Granulicella sp. L46 TaxID=1641865 RepID=UPI0035280D86
MGSGGGYRLNHSATELLSEPFFFTKSTGMGVGLYVCRLIIERFRGRLSATRNEGPGASFELSIPCSSCEVAEA